MNLVLSRKRMYLQIWPECTLMWLFSFITCTMDKKTRIDWGSIVSQQVSVWHERAWGRATRPWVGAKLFDGSQGRGSQRTTFTPQSRMSQTSTSQGHMSPAYEANNKEPISDAYASVNSYPRGLFDTSLLHLYGKHAARHVWKWEIYLFTFASHMFYINLIASDGDIFSFTGASMFKICKPRKGDFKIGTTQIWLVQECSPLLWACRFMCCCIQDHKPWHAGAICREMTFQYVIFPPSYWRDVHYPIWRMMPPTSSHQGKLLDHRRLNRDEANKMMVTYLGVDPNDAQNEVADTRGVHSRIKFLEHLYKDHL